MILHDLICSDDSCNLESLDTLVDGQRLHDGEIKCTCGAPMVIMLNGGVSRNAAPHKDETTVVYHNPKTGEIQYPGRNDRPMPDRLMKRGFQRRELHPRDMPRFERIHNVCNERFNYDRNGRSYDGADS